MADISKRPLIMGDEEVKVEPLTPVQRMRQASGSVNTHDRLVMFLYLLARGETTTGAIDDIIDYKMPKNNGEFTNGWLAEWAMDAAARLRFYPGGAQIIRGETEPIVGGAGSLPARRWWAPWRRK